MLAVQTTSSCVFVSKTQDKISRACKMQHCTINLVISSNDALQKLYFQSKWSHLTWWLPVLQWYCILQATARKTIVTISCNKKGAHMHNHLADDDNPVLTMVNIQLQSNICSSVVAYPLNSMRCEGRPLHCNGFRDSCNSKFEFDEPSMSICHFFLLCDTNKINTHADCVQEDKCPWVTLLWWYQSNNQQLGLWLHIQMKKPQHDFVGNDVHTATVSERCCL